MLEKIKQEKESVLVINIEIKKEILRQNMGLFIVQILWQNMGQFVVKRLVLL